MLKIYIQRRFFDNKKGIQKNVVLKIQKVRTCFGASSTYRIFFFWKNYNLNFWWYFKFLKLIIFGQILTKFGNFGLFWVETTAMAVADSMPLFGKKKKTS
jgi:hypothetical protein